MNPLRKIMDKHGLSASEVAEITGRTVNTVYMWLTKKHRDVPPDVLTILEQHLIIEGLKKRLKTR